MSSNHQTTNKSHALLRVLLVEDQIIPAKVAMLILASLNCQIDHAPNGQTALALTEQQHYDLILMDIGLPDISGLEVTKQLRARETKNQTPIIALTAHIDSNEKQICMEAGMNAVFSKPLNKEMANTIVNTFLVSTPTISKFGT